MRSLVSAGRDTIGRSGATTRAAAATALLLMVWFVLAPGSLALVWVVGYAAIVVGFLYRQWDASRYVTHEPTNGEIVFVLAIAVLWTALLAVLYVAVVAVRFVIGSIMGLFGGAL